MHKLSDSPHVLYSQTNVHLKARRFPGSATPLLARVCLGLTHGVHLIRLTSRKQTHTQGSNICSGTRTRTHKSTHSTSQLNLTKQNISSKSDSTQKTGRHSSTTVKVRQKPQTLGQYMCKGVYQPGDGKISQL